MRALFRRISYWVRARREAAALREEIEFHRSMTQAQMERDGLTPDEATFAARRQMGNVAIAREDANAVCGSGHGSRASDRMRRTPYAVSGGSRVSR